MQLKYTEGVLLKEIKWRQNCNYMGYRFVAIAIENGQFSK